MSYNSPIRETFTIRIPTTWDEEEKLLGKIQKCVPRKLGDDKVPTVLSCLRAIGWNARPVHHPDCGISFVVKSSSVIPESDLNKKILKLLKDYIVSEDGQDPYFDITSRAGPAIRVTISKDKITVNEFETFLILTDDTQEIKKAAYYFVKSLVDRNLSKDDIEALLKQAMVEAILED